MQAGRGCVETDISGDDLFGGKCIEPFRVSRLSTLLALVEKDCRIVAQSRNYGPDDEISDLRLIVRPRAP